jgi:hypothetical protein
MVQRRQIAVIGVLGQIAGMPVSWALLSVGMDRLYTAAVGEPTVSCSSCVQPVAEGTTVRRPACCC